MDTNNITIQCTIFSFRNPLFNIACFRKMCISIVTNIYFSFLQVRVNVLDKNDSPPSFGEQPILFTVSEELGAGQTVGVVKARDPDTLGRVRYTLREPQGRDKFSLDPDSGTLRLLEPLDRETKDLYKLVIRASDGLQNTDTTITIHVRSIRNTNFPFHRGRTHLSIHITALEEQIQVKSSG